MSFMYTFHEYVISYAYPAVYLWSSFNARYIYNIQHHISINLQSQKYCYSSQAEGAHLSLNEKQS